MKREIRDTQWIRAGTQVLDIRLPPGLADGDIVQLDGLRGDIRLRVNIASAV